jgi:hypothetical protein
MTGQGWMVDDGTCDPCVHGLCYRCTKVQEWATTDQGFELVCCCENAYHVGYAEPPEDDR